MKSFAASFHEKFVFLYEKEWFIPFFFFGSQVSKEAYFPHECHIILPLRWQYMVLFFFASKQKVLLSVRNIYQIVGIGFKALVISLPFCYTRDFSGFSFFHLAMMMIQSISHDPSTDN